MPRSNPNSPRALMRVYLKDHTAEETVAYAQTLGMKPGKANRLIKKLTTTGRVRRTEPGAPLQQELDSRSSKFPVYLFNDPETVCRVIKAGDEQSIVKFPNGNERVVCNSWLTTGEKNA